MQTTSTTEQPERPLSHEELLLAQLGQTILAQRAQAVAVIEQCDASLMVVRALQDREDERAAGITAAQPDSNTTNKRPPMFGEPRAET